MTTATGQIVAVSQAAIGSILATDAAIGDTAITVDDSADFDEAGGTLGINGVPAAYTTIDPDADAITLAAALTAAAATGDQVTVWDTTRNTGCTELTAQVAVEGDDDNDDPIMAIVSHALADRIPEGIRDAGAGESVQLTLDGGVWYVTEILGLQPIVDGTMLAGESVGTPAIAPGAITLPLLDPSVSARNLGGTTTTIGTTPPATATQGDVFINQATGQISVSDGSTWTPVTFNASDVIQAGTIDAAQVNVADLAAGMVAAGTVIAGAVNGTTITGATLTASGGGTISAEMVSNALKFSGVGASSTAFLSVQSNGTGTSSTPQTNLSGSTDSDHVPQVIMQGESADGTQDARLILQTYSLSTAMAVKDGVVQVGALVATQPGSISGTAPAGVPEVWHNVTPPSGWSGTLRYRKTAENEVKIQAALSTSSAATGTVMLFTLTGEYVPTVQADFAIRTFVGSAPSNVEYGGRVTTGGVVEAINLASMTNISFIQNVPLD